MKYYTLEDHTCRVRVVNYKHEEALNRLLPVVYSINTKYARLEYSSGIQHLQIGTIEYQFVVDHFMGVYLPREKLIWEKPEREVSLSLCKACSIAFYSRDICCGTKMVPLTEKTFLQEIS